MMDVWGVAVSRLLFEKSSKSGVLKENIFDEDEVIAEEISDQTTTPNKKTKTKKRKKQTHAT